MNYEFEILLITMLLLPAIAIVYDLIRVINHFQNIKSRKNLSLEQKNYFKEEVKGKTKIFTKRILLPVFLNLVPIITSFLIFSKIFLPEPQIVSTNPEQKGSLASYEHPITIIFDKPIDQNKIDFHISPEIEGELKFKYTLPFSNISRIIEFYPKTSLIPGEKVMVYLSHISNIANPNPGHEYLLEFYSKELPEVKSVSIENNIADVPVTQPINIEYQNGSLHSDWDITIEPEIEMELFINSKEETLEIEFPQELKQSTTYTLGIYQIPQIYEVATGKVIERLEKLLVQQYTFSTVKAPLISSIEPNGDNVLTNINELVINFDQPMNSESVESLLKIEPEVSKEYIWNEEKTQLKTATELLKNTEYTITIQKRTESLAGGIVEEDYIHKFTTVGEVYVSSINPSNGSSGVSVTSSITLNLNQPIDFESAKSNLTVYLANNSNQQVTGTITGDQYTIIFSPSTSYSYSTKYNVKLESGITSIYGLDSTKDSYYEFTTESQISKLNVAWDGQDVSYTCNFAATKMALTAKGVYVTETNLMNLAGREPDFNFSTMSGGNPHKGFVNYYGTYWEPMSKAVSNYRPNMVKSGWTLAEVCTEISKGNPIVTWGQNGWTTDTPRNWTATDGEYITGFSGMHSVTIIGCEGDITNPSYIFIQDPWRKWGNKLTAAEMLRRWSYFGNTGMVVY